MTDWRLITMKGVLGLVITILIFINVYMLNKDASQTLASWVQAIGSICAIIGVFIVARQQRHHELVRHSQQKIEQAQEYLRFAALTCAEAMTVIRPILAEVCREGRGNIPMDHRQRLYEGLSIVGSYIDEIRPEMLAGDFMKLILKVRTGIHIMRVGFNPQAGRFWTAELDVLRDMLETQKQRMEDAVELLIAAIEEADNTRKVQ